VVKSARDPGEVLESGRDVSRALLEDLAPVVLVSAHHPSDFVIGMSAAHVASGLPSGASPATRALRSFRLTYCSLLVTPRRTHEASRGRGDSSPSKTLSRSAVGTGSPTTASTLPIRQEPRAARYERDDERPHFGEASRASTGGNGDAGRRVNV
jgi:hypothetical protein